MDFTTFNDMLRRMAWRLPEKIFLHWADRGRSLTYSQVEEISEHVAGALAALGVEKGDRVGIFAHNGLDYILAMFGSWKLGAISCHINVLQAEDLLYFVKNATPKVLIYTHDMFPIIAKHRSEMSSIKHYLCMDGMQDGALDWNEQLARKLPAPMKEVSGGDPAHLSYTSGSSGMPKGAVLAHGPTAKASHCIAERLEISSSDVSLGPTSPASSYGLVANLLPSLHRGATVGLMSRWDAERAWEVMEECDVTYFPGNPLLFAEIQEVCRIRGVKPSSWRLAVSGGAPVPPGLKEVFHEEFGVFLVESYGQSELGGFVSLGYPKREPKGRADAIGPALPDKEVRILDTHDHEVPIGEPGEMCIRGGFMVGYWDMAEKTREVIRDGWLHTGDMGQMDSEGYISMLGRWSERIVSSGKAIFPRLMEESLMRHRAVLYAAVIGAPDKEAGELPKAIVSLHDSRSTSEEELLSHCYVDIGVENSPISLEIIEEMPMTATGKIGRAQLQERERAASS